MTKQEQIDEMAKFMHYKAHGKDKDCDNEKCEMCWCSCKNDAEALYNAGYRKLPDGAVVLLIGKNNQALDEKTIEYFVKHNEQIREEAVKEFAGKVKEKALSHCRTINCYELKFIEETIDELLKEYEK